MYDHYRYNSGGSYDKSTSHNTGTMVELLELIANIAEDSSGEKVEYADSQLNGMEHQLYLQVLTQVMESFSLLKKEYSIRILRYIKVLKMLKLIHQVI